VLRDPVTQKRFQDLGAEAAPDASPAAFQSFIANDVEQWRDIVRSIDAKLD
jgi:tripartite-type tricarboxylate transporter receptor subunit TctC